MAHQAAGKSQCSRWLSMPQQSLLSNSPGPFAAPRALLPGLLGKVYWEERPCTGHLQVAPLPLGTPRFGRGHPGLDVPKSQAHHPSTHLCPTASWQLWCRGWSQGLAQFKATELHPSLVLQVHSAPALRTSHWPAIEKPLPLVSSRPPQCDLTSHPFLLPLVSRMFHEARPHLLVTA